MGIKTLKIGIVGFSLNQFDKTASRKILRNLYTELKAKHPHEKTQIVSGYTNAGIPQIAYQLADEFGFTTVGFSARQALSVSSGLYPVNEVILRGERFGDESQAFVDYIDVLIRIGGGQQSRKEVALFKTKHAGESLSNLLKEYEVEWYGK